MHPVMNDTKWDKLRIAMYELGPLSPKWRTLDTENGYLSPWDSEWYYHFRDGGYRTIQWVEIAVTTEAQRETVLSQLAKIHLPGEETESGFRIFGYVADGQVVDYLRPSNSQLDTDAQGRRST
jgi:hypothetical protein